MEVIFSLKATCKVAGSILILPLTRVNTGGYHVVRVGDKFAGGRYSVLQKLGWGHFSTVWLVLDSDTGQHAALKVCPSRNCVDYVIKVCPSK